MNIKVDQQAFIFIGKSGSGKGTQAKLLMEYLGSKGRKVFRIESGEFFRDFITQSSYTAHLADKLMKDGLLQPLFLAINSWASYFANHMDKDRDVIIDGTPRRLDEAKLLDETFKFYGLQKINVIYIDVSDKWSVDRLKGRGRDDDKEMDNINNRLAWFNEAVDPAIEYYRNNPYYRFFDINGEQTVEEVQKEIISKLGF